MTASQAFDVLNLIALSAWVLLALSPRLPRVALLVAGRVVPVMLAIVYVALIAINWRGSEGGFSSLTAVGILFDNSWILLAGWTHYLAFDLLVGNWEMADAQARGVRYALVLPCLLLTFLFGPAGWLLYMTARRSANVRTPSSTEMHADS
jgi:hypothetical protein